MRVALVSSGSGSRGGGEIYLAVLAEGLAALGADVLALLPEGEKMDSLANTLGRGAAVRRFAFRATYERRLRTVGAALDRRGQARLAALFAALPVDLVHVNQQVAEDGVDLVLAAARSGRPWLSTIHVGRGAQALGARFGGVRDRVAVAALCRAGGLHIAVSAASRDQLAGRLRGGTAPALRVVHNGVPLPDPTDLAAARIAARADWGAGPGEVVVGAVGRIEAQKNPAALVDHLAPLAGGGGVRLAWIGDGALRGALEARARAARLPLVVDGWRPDAPTRLAGLDVFLLPSRFEGLPLALLEAMHAGLPVVAARTDGIVEAVRHGDTGLLCAEPAEWRAAATRLVADRGLRERLGAAARTAARERFSVGAMAAATRAVYVERIAAATAAPAAAVTAAAA